MIDNKIISITKQNTFNKGWTLFSLFSQVELKNHSFREVKPFEVVRLITYAKDIKLILSENCLSSAIVNELIWVQKFIQIDLIAKDKTIAETYSKIAFHSVSIDGSVTFNYIGIFGKEDRYFIISNGFCEVDDSINKLYFGGEKAPCDYAFLSDIKEIYLMDKVGILNQDQLIQAAKARGCTVNYVVSAQGYSKKVFEYAKEKNINLFVSEYVGGGTVLVNGYNELSAVVMIKEGVYVPYAIKDTFLSFGKLYRCLFLDDEIDCLKIASDVYSCYGDKIERFVLDERLVLERMVNDLTMLEYIAEDFDKSETESHNDYSAKYKSVEYRFTLVPPIIDDTYSVSKIYLPIYEEVEKINNTDSNTLKKEISSLQGFSTDSKLSIILKQIIRNMEWLKNATQTNDYKGYYEKLSTFCKMVEDAENNLLDYCKQLFLEVSEESSDTKYDKFDVEIEGYKDTIAEKTILVEQGVDVLGNSRRIEILKKKIQDLLELKQKFIGSESSRTGKEADQFVEKCKAILEKRNINGNDNDSIGQVLKKNDEKKIDLLNVFIESYLFDIYVLLEKCHLISEKLLVVQIPEDYKVYEKNETRYIVIDDIDEVEKTKKIREDFSLSCLTRRKLNELRR